MVFSGIDTAKQELITKLWSRIFRKPSEEYEISFEKGEGVSVSKSGKALKVIYGSDRELYRSLLLCAQLISDGKDVEIKEKAQFDNTGIMLDMSRAGVMKVEKVKEYMEYMALCGLNSLMLYTEDTYKVEGYDYFGYMRGRYTKDELKEIDAYGLKYGIEVIPCIQTLGHLEQYIKWAEGQKMSDTGTVLMIGSPKVYEFIDKMISTVSECFTTRKIHIGMDEAWGMGTGKYLSKNGYRDVVDIFSEHLNEIRKITDKYNLEPMIWSDMYFRMSSKKDAYYDPEIVMNPRAKELLPDNVTLVYWDYYHEKESFYDYMIKNHYELTDKVAFAGGIWLWRGFIPDYKFTHLTTQAALESCKKNNIKDVYATVWGDDGCETDQMFSLVGCLLYGEHAFNKEFSYDTWKKNSEILFGVNVDDFLDLSEVLLPERQQLYGEKNGLSVKQIIYNDPLCGLVDYELKDRSYLEKYKALYEKYVALGKEESYYTEHYQYVSYVCKVAMGNLEMVYKLQDGYNNKDTKLLNEVKDRIIPTLIEDYDVLKNAHYNLWHSTFRPFGFEVADGRLGFKVNRLKSAIMRITDFIEGRISSLPELEEERLPFNGNIQGYNHKSISSAYVK